MIPGSESPATTNSFIERQKQMLLELEGGVPPTNPETQVDAPPQDPQDDTAAAPPAPPAAPPSPAPAPAAPAPTDDVSALRARLDEFEHRYNSLHGRLEPTQQALAAAQRRIEELERQVATPPQPTVPDPDDQELNDFEILYGDMVPGMKKFVQKRILEPALAPLQPAIQQGQASADEAKTLADRRAYLAPVVAKYPNASAILTSPEFHNYVESMPSFVAQQVKDMLLEPEKRTKDVSQIMAIFDDYASRQVAPPAAPPAPQAPPVDPGQMAAVPRTIPTALAPGGANAPQFMPLTEARRAVINATLTGRHGQISDEQRKALWAELEQGEQAAVMLGRGVQSNQTLR